MRQATIPFEPAGASAVGWSADVLESIGVVSNAYLMRQVSNIGGGTIEMARNVISERVLGMPRERRPTATFPSGKSRGDVDDARILGV